MDEYIDREHYCRTLCRGPGLGQGCSKAECPLWQAPAADAAEVVRCRDCRWLHVGMRDMWCRMEGGLLTPEPDAFCSFGERKAGEKGQGL